MGVDLGKVVERFAELCYPIFYEYQDQAIKDVCAQNAEGVFCENVNIEGQDIWRNSRSLAINNLCFQKLILKLLE